MIALALMMTAANLTSPVPAGSLAVHREAQSGRRSHQLRLDMGFASALGFGGLAYSYIPSTFLQIEAGVGVGFTGAQLSLMPKMTAGTDRHKFVLGAGFSAGIGDQGLIKTTDDGSLGAVFFFNADIGYQFVADNGFTFNVGVGPTLALNGSVSCGWEKPRTCSPGGFIQGRIGFGYTF